MRHAAKLVNTFKNKPISNEPAEIAIEDKQLPFGDGSIVNPLAFKPMTTVNPFKVNMDVVSHHRTIVERQQRKTDREPMKKVIKKQVKRLKASGKSKKGIVEQNLFEPIAFTMKVFKEPIAVPRESVSKVIPCNHDEFMKLVSFIFCSSNRSLIHDNFK